MENKLPLPQVKPEEVGMSSERLARLRPAMQSFIDRNQTPNFVTLVAREGKIVHFESSGICRLRDSKTGNEGYHFPALFQYQTDNRRGSYDTLRRRLTESE